MIVRFVDTKHYFVLVADAANKTFSLCRSDPEKFLYLMDKQANVTADQWHTIMLMYLHRALQVILMVNCLLRDMINTIKTVQLGL